MRNSCIAVWLSLIVFSACSTRTEPDTETFDPAQASSRNQESREVIYSMYLPTDMTLIFKRSGTNYDPGIAAPIEDITLYQEKEQIAVMLGIFGVDITYMKMLDQSALAAEYYAAMQTLAMRTGLPSSIFESAADRVEAYFSSNDTLPAVIEEIYQEADLSFKQNGDDNLAALALLGGWIEAVYIGARIYEQGTGDADLAEKLLQQKFSLNSIYTILSNHQESLRVKSYLLMLRKLRKVYNKVEIRFRKEGFSVDTTQKKLQGYEAQIRCDEQTMDELISTIQLIREELIRISAESTAMAFVSANAKRPVS